MFTLTFMPKIVGDDARKVVVSFRLSPDLLTFAMERAAAKKITLSAWLERCVVDARKRMVEPKGK